MSSGLRAFPPQSQVQAGAQVVHTSAPTAGFLRGAGAESISSLEAGRAELRVPPEGCRLGESFASPTAALPDAQSLLYQVPSCGGPVTFVWAGGHV